MPTLNVKFKLEDEVYLAYLKRNPNVCIYSWVYEGLYKICEIRFTEYGTLYYVSGAEWLHGYEGTPSFRSKNLFKTERGAAIAAVRFHNKELQDQMINKE